MTSNRNSLIQTALIAALSAGVLTLGVGVTTVDAKARKVAAAPVAPSILATDWIKVDPDNLLVIDTSRGRVLVELYPSLAPQTVERIKVLARRHFYDGQTFFRVIDQFMAQTGDPTNTGAGGSDLPNVAAEFEFRRGPDFPFVPVTSDGPQVSGFSGAMPIVGQSDALMTMSATGTAAAWGTFCSGVAGMARAGAPDSGNSQFFLIRQNSTSLDQKYTAFGRVLTGLDSVRLIKVGEPVPSPQDSMTRVRLASDLPAGEVVKIARINPASAYYRFQIEKLRDAKGPDFSVCDVDILTNPNL